MLEEIIKNLALLDCLTELNSTEWLRLSTDFTQEPDELKRVAFIKALSTHSGVPVIQIQTAFSSLTQMTLSTDAKERILFELQKTQTGATLKITAFQQRSIFKKMNLESLSISRAQWNILISRFEQQQREHVTRFFFLSTLSSIKRVSFDNLSDAATLSREQPARKGKRKYQEEEDKDISTTKRVAQEYREDDGINPFIFASTVKNPELETKLEATGVRVGVPLSPATPEKGYPHLMRTPGKTKVRPVCEIDNAYRLFKPVTPYGKVSGKDRIDVRKASQARITSALPKLVFDRAQPVQFTPTRESILGRSGTKRESLLALMRESAANVFRAHGATINSSAESRSKHWAHIVTSCLIDFLEATPEDPEKEIIPVVPSTAEANYNTLEAIELFVRHKLLNKDTDKIHIYVKPIYSGESLIPDVLVYKLNWSETNKKGETIQCKELFYIGPQSHYRLTKSMHQSIGLLRDTRETDLPSEEMQVDENSNPNIMFR
ncbi:hypothetical protein [Legionella maioricensis]|uniref:Uncharacterized protein n=1 Tax=Legionella maioricensis TaxID=2896528 RepID=A0A9X2CZB1_9GAMM|nr:hypothetical protein [Legionella maioricensis]MCL9683220.1 hypothetical protein [Legionella maioricensis]MCL9686082.1 hypothetical protein [Legionella maioricensis]